MTDFSKKLLSQIAGRPGITDRELTNVLLGPNEHPSRVNQTARMLELRGRLIRVRRDDGRIGNYIQSSAPDAPVLRSSSPAAYKVDGSCPLDLDELKGSLSKATQLAGFPIPDGQIQFQWLPCPHRRPSSLPSGKQAVYCFLLGSRWLKVGKAGRNSGPRFTSHHYYCKAPSTLAKSILARKERLLALLEAEMHADLHAANEEVIGKWIEKNTARLNVLIPADPGPHILSLVEAFLHCRLQPLFEGNGRISHEVLTDPATS